MGAYQSLHLPRTARAGGAWLGIGSEAFPEFDAFVTHRFPGGRPAHESFVSTGSTKRPLIRHLAGRAAGCKAGRGTAGAQKLKTSYACVIYSKSPAIESAHMAEPDPQTLVSAVERSSAEAARSLTLLLTICLVFLATVIETSHRDLFLNTTKPLPNLARSLPLIAIFVVVPVAITMLHVIAMLQLRTLVLLVGDLWRLRRSDPNAESPPLVYRLPPSLIVQWVLSRHQRWRPTTVVISALALILWVILPLVTLLAAQWRFLPYHSDGITMLHRGLVLIDVSALAAVLVLAWRRIEPATGDAAGGVGPRRLKPTRTWATAALVLGGAGLAAALFLLTVPESPLERGTVAFAKVLSPPLPKLSAASGGGATNCEAWTFNPFVLLTVKPVPLPGVGAEPREMLCVVYLLMENPNTSPRSLRRNLVMREAILADSAPTEEMIQRLGEAEAWRVASAGVNVAGRDLRYADLTGAHLQGVNLRGADLTGARLAWSRLAFADFGDIPLGEIADCPPAALSEWRGIQYCRTRLTHADLSDARLHRTVFWRAEVTGARLENARFLVTDLRLADLAELDLAEHDMPGVRMEGADLTGTDLSGADLRGANLDGARLIGTTLREARLDGATLRGARWSITLRAGERAHALTGLGLRGTDLSGAKIALVWSDPVRADDPNPRDEAYWADLHTPPPRSQADEVATLFGERATGVDANLAEVTDVAVRLPAALAAAARDDRADAPCVSPTCIAYLEQTEDAGDHAVAVRLQPAGERQALGYELRLARALVDLACKADRDGVTRGVAQRVAAAATRPRRTPDYERHGQVRLFEYVTAVALQSRRCAAADSLGDRALCRLNRVETLWPLSAATEGRLEVLEARPSDDEAEQSFIGALEEQWGIQRTKDGRRLTIRASTGRFQPTRPCVFPE